MSIIYTTNYSLIKRSYLDSLWHISVNGNWDLLDSTLFDMQTDLDLKLYASTRGAADGVASLDGSTLVPVAQIPALPISKTTNLQTTLDGKVTNETLSIGDLLYCSATGTPGTITRLPKGSEGQVLLTTSNIPTWSTSPWQSNVITTLGDIVKGGSTGVPERLGAGANGYVLTSDTGDISWAPIPDILTNALPANLGAVAATGTATGAARADHVHSWTGVVNNVMTGVGDMIYGGATGAPTRRAPGATGNILTMAAGVPTWAANAAGILTPLTQPSNLGATSAIGVSTESARADHVHSANIPSPIFTGTMTLPAGSTGVPIAKFQAGVKLTTPVAHAVDWDGSRVYVTDSTPTRHQLVYFDDLQYLSAGVLIKPVYSDLGTGHLYVGNTGTYTVFPSADGSGTPVLYTGVTGFTGMTMTDGSVNYVVLNYNSGSPAIQVLTSDATINETTIIPIVAAYRDGNNLHIWDYDQTAMALSNKLSHSILKTSPLRWETGFEITESGTRNVNVAGGTIWRGATEHILSSFASGSTNMTFFYHVASAWTSSSIATYNNTQYDNGTDLVTLGSGRYAVNFIYRGVETTDTDVYYVLGSGDYTIAEARNAQPPTKANLPIIISSHAMLIGRIIVQKSVNTALQIDNAFGGFFFPTSVTSSISPVFVSTADAVVTNTTAPTSLIGTGVGNLTLPANYFESGSRVRLRLSGTLVNTGTPNLGIAIKLGATSIVDTGAISMTNVSGTTQWNLEGDVICRSDGATGAFKAHARLTYFDGTTQRTIRDANTGTVAINTTVTQALDIQATWGTATGADAMTCDMVMIEGSIV